MSGSAIKIWLITSGGVTMAAKIKMTTIAYLKYSFSILSSTRPIFAKKNVMTGSSNENSKANK